MIRMEGIPNVAARLAAARKSAKVTESGRPVQPPRQRQRLVPRPTTTVRGPRPRTNAQVYA